MVDMQRFLEDVHRQALDDPEAVRAAGVPRPVFKSSIWEMGPDPGNLNFQKGMLK